MWREFVDGTCSSIADASFHRNASLLLFGVLALFAVVNNPAPFLRAFGINPILMQAFQQTGLSANTTNATTPYATTNSVNTTTLENVTNSTTTVQPTTTINSTATVTTQQTGYPASFANYAIKANRGIATVSVQKTVRSFDLNISSSVLTHVNTSLKSPVGDFHISITNQSTSFQQNTTTIASPAYQYIQIAEGSTSPSNPAFDMDQYVSHVTYDFSVADSWIESHNISSSSIRLFKYQSDKWLPLPTQVVSSNTTQTLFSSNSSSFSNYVISYVTGNTQSSSSTNMILIMPIGYTSYIVTCGTGGYNMPATSFLTTNVGASPPSGALCNGNSPYICAAVGYQTSATGWCDQSSAWYMVIAGVGANVIMSNAQVFSAANNTAGSSVSLSYTVAVPNSLVIIAGTAGWEDGSFTVPSGCTQKDYVTTSGQDSSYDMVCNQNPGTYSTVLTLDGQSVGTTAAYVFAPYNVVLNDLPSTANIVTNGGITYGSGSIMTVIGGNPVNAMPPASGNFVFSSWTVSDPANIIISNSLAANTFLTVEGPGTLTANFNALTTFSETGLPNSAETWNVIYDGINQNVIAPNSIAFSTSSGLYSYTVNEVVIGSTVYTPTPASGTTSAGNAVPITFSTSSGTCTIILSPSNVIAFGQVSPGSGSPTNVLITDQNTGTATAEMLVAGLLPSGNWISGSSSFYVSNTAWNPTSLSAFGGNLLSPNLVDTSMAVSGGGSSNIYFGLKVPPNQPAGAYNSIITIENSC